MCPRGMFWILVYLSHWPKRIRSTSSINLLIFFSAFSVFCFFNLRLIKVNSKNNSSINKQGEPIFACKLCPKNVTDNDNAILCNLCQTWVHIKCNHYNYMDYKYLQGCNEPWYCLSCSNTLFPFSNLNNQVFVNFIGNNNTITSSETI